MFYCPLHNWTSYEEPCPACHPTITTTIGNSTGTSEQPKEWEIVNFKTRDGHHATKDSPLWKVWSGESKGIISYETCLEQFTIYSVKRNSDSEVFSVGDEVKITSKAVLAWDRNPIHEIRYFGIGDDKELFICCHTDIPVCYSDIKSEAYKSGTFLLNEIDKLSKFPSDERKQSKQPSITIEDNSEPIKEVIVGGTKFYSQHQLDEAIQKAFFAGRLYHPFAGLKYDTPEDYINSLNTNTKTSKHWT